MMTVFSAPPAFGISSTANAGPKRPLTFVVDTRLSEGPAENFSSLLVNPNRLASHLKPLDSAEGLVPKATVMKTKSPSTTASSSPPGRPLFGPLATRSSTVSLRPSSTGRTSRKSRLRVTRPAAPAATSTSR